jgi:hypothetical protein
MRLRSITFIWLFVATVAFSEAAQPATQTERPSPRPQYQSLRYEEDWSALRDSSLRTDAWDSLKYLPLNEDGWYLSLGGDSSRPSTRGAAGYAR